VVGHGRVRFCLVQVFFFLEIGPLSPAFFGGNVRDAGVEPPPAGSGVFALDFVR
jgi:hypothetical protein